MSGIAGRRPEKLPLLAAGALVILAAGALAVGGGTFPQGYRVVLLIRLPEVLTALLAGGCLGLSGHFFQTVLKNPLADPYVLGIAGGASLGAVLMILPMGAGIALGAGLPARVLSALLFGHLTLLLLLWASRGALHTLLLGGIIANTACAALARILTAWLSPAQLSYVTTFLIGFVPTPPLWAPLLLAIPAGACMAWFSPRARALELLHLSAGEAMSLGLRVRRFRAGVLFAGTLLASACVALTGMLGFVGLVAPHAARKLSPKARQGELLWLSFLLGACFLLAAHWLVKLLAPAVLLPVGAATTAAGAPVFLALLWRRRKGQ